MLPHSVHSPAFPFCLEFFLFLWNHHIRFSSNPHKRQFKYNLQSSTSPDSPLPCGSFNHTVFHTVLIYHLPYLPGHLISTKAPFISVVPAHLLSYLGVYSGEKKSNKIAIILFSCNCKYESAKWVQPGASASQCLPVSHLSSVMYSSRLQCCLIFSKPSLEMQHCHQPSWKEE